MNRRNFLFNTILAPVMAGLFDTVPLGKLLNKEIQPKEDFQIPRQLFSNFIFGPENQESFLTCRYAADHLDRFRLLIIQSECGMGKTHLMKAIMNSVTEKERKGIFVIDDFHVIPRSEMIQEVFLERIQSLQDEISLVILTTDKAPREIIGLKPKVKAFVDHGHLIYVAPPGLPSRLAILRQKIKQNKMNVPDDVIGFLATFPGASSPRYLENYLARLKGQSEVEGVPITLAWTEKVIRKI